ncbi:MAG: BrnA antitoxin family protein [Methylococcaceae bacterium]|nr:BrnA antitoxin family protein [Methylococcaceae bacterium]
MNENKRALGSDLKKIDAHAITPEEYEEIPELTDEWFEKAMPMIGGEAVTREEWQTAARKAVRRGRPKARSRKLLLSVRYSPEVVAYFRATGDGWQARMDDVLKEWIKAHPHHTCLEP